jgi:hypothetical protein
MEVDIGRDLVGMGRLVGEGMGRLDIRLGHRGVML